MNLMQSRSNSQVTLEEQMICGALQTLNEEAFEDVVGSERPSPTGIGPSGELLAQQDMLHTQTFTSHHLSQTAKQSQLAPIKEGTEQCTATQRATARRASQGFINNLLTNFGGSGNNQNSTNATQNGGTYTIIDSNHAGGVDPVPTVIIMPSSFESAHDDTRL